MTDIDYNQVVLDKLEIGSYDFDYQLDSDYFSQLDHPFVLGGLVRAKAHLNLRADDYDLTISVHGQVSVTCDRCLEPMNIDIDEEEMLDSEEIFNLQSSISNQILDLKWLAYELIVVNLPTVHCHPEGGCNPEMIALLQNHLCSTSEEPEIL
ncbi:MAG: DUF177 domain-containing protein [Paludibacteraceae bacterium]|nr:DUF177 domain-containing protein [Paludibacteraceae bacterium]